MMAAPPPARSLRVNGLFVSAVDRLQTVLKDLDAGRLDPAEAMRRLQAIDPPPSTDPPPPVQSAGDDPNASVTLATILQDHGPPPRTVLDRWTDALTRNWTSHASGIDPSEDVDLQAWRIDATGRLTSNPSPAHLSETYIAETDIAETDPAGTDVVAVTQYVRRLRERIQSGESSSSTDPENETAPPPTRSIAAGPAPMQRPVTVAVGSAAALLLGLGWFVWSSQTSARRVATDTSDASMGRTAPAPSATRRNVGTPASPDADPGKLTTFDASIASADPSTVPLPELDAVTVPRPVLELDDPVDSSGSSDREPANEPSSANDPLDADGSAALAAMMRAVEMPQTGEKTSGAATAPSDPPPPPPPVQSDIAPMVDLTSDQDRREPPAEKQATDPAPVQTLVVTAVDLPQPTDRDPVMIDRPLHEITGIEFSGDQPPRVSIQTSGVEKTVVAPEGVVAELSGTEAGGFAWRWTDLAADAKSVPSIFNARLTGGGPPVYLRRPITGASYSPRFDQFDARPVWDVKIAPRRGRSQVALRVTVPPPLELDWMDTQWPDESWSTDAGRGFDPAGGRAIAVITPGVEEESAMALRFDVRVGRRVSVRIRAAGRVATQNPWTLLSARGLDDAIAAQTRYAMLVSREAERLDRVDPIAYDIAGRLGKRIITEKIRRNDERIEQTRVVIERLQQLRGMMQSLQSGGGIGVTIHTEWPDARQLILETSAAES